MLIKYKNNYKFKSYLFHLKIYYGILYFEYIHLVLNDSYIYFKMLRPLLNYLIYMFFYF